MYVYVMLGYRIDPNIKAQIWKLLFTNNGTKHGITLVLPHVTVHKLDHGGKDVFLYQH